MKYLDRSKASAILAEQLKKEEVESADLILEGDEFWNTETIYKDGDHYKQDGFGCYPLSRWATPRLVIYYKDGKEQRFDCYFEEDGNEDRVEVVEEDLQKEREKIKDDIKKLQQ